VRLERKLPNGATHVAVFIPSKVWQNKILMQRDPDYINRLYLVGGAQLVKAWLEGDWSAIEGAYFPEFSLERHVVTPCELPAEWPHKYREWYGMPPNQPNVGLKLTAEEIADGIVEREKGEVVMSGVIDPATCAQDGGPSIRERLWKRGTSFAPADNKRVGTFGAAGRVGPAASSPQGGWREAHDLLLLDLCAHHPHAAHAPARCRARGGRGHER
jgi:hypothetical protein